MRSVAAESGGIELLADADRPGGWLLLVDGVRQSYVDLDEPTYLDFEYVQTMADVLATLPDGPLAVTHVGGGGCTLARYLASVRPGSTQLVLEPDAALIALVRARLPLPRGARIRIREVDGRAGVAALRDASADVVLLDAFTGGRVPVELTTVEFVTDVARVLRAAGVLLANVADGPPVEFTRRLAATLAAAFPSVLVTADPAVLKGRRHGNVVFAASRSRLPLAEVRREIARGPFPMSVLADRELVEFTGGAKPIGDAAPMPSPMPPDELWRVGHWDDL